MPPLITSLCAALTLAACATNPSTDLYSGTWVRNLEESGSNARSQVLTVSVTGERETYRSELRLPGETLQVTNYTAAYDGREYPSHTVITEPGRAAVERNDTVILRKIDAHIRERHWKQGGRVVRILRREVSTDGRRLTSRMITVDEQGQERFDGVLLFERLAAP